jgi:hypothetical protein
VNGTIRDAAGNDLDASKTLATMSTDNLADNKDITVDTTDPTIGAIGITAGEEQLDANCRKTVSYEVTITDNCCIDLDASPIAVTPSATNATVSELTMTCNPDTGKVASVLVTGTFVVSVTDACTSVPSVQVDVVDCVGNTATRTDSGPTVSDGTAPTFSNFAVTPADGIVDTNCEETVSFSVDVHDNCSVDLDDPTAIVVAESATNASTSGLVWSVDKAGLQSDFTITGSFTVESLTGCPAVPTVEVRVADLCGKEGTASQDGAGIIDDIVPVIHDLMFYTDATYTVRGTDFYVDDCCSARLYFAAYVTDNCCVRPEQLSIGLFVPTGNGQVVGGGADRIQNGPNRVDVRGYVDVACLTSCPARAEIRINAADCCGNPAVSQTTLETEGFVWDTVEPIPRDDPRQDMVLDESAIVDPLVGVRLDEFGTYRLNLPQDTPVRIDVVANDADNCSCADCAHPFDPCGGCGACSGCCAALTIHEIVKPPVYGTATIEDDEGDCTGGSVIRYAPDQGYIGPDEFTYRIRDACGNVSQEATVYVAVVCAPAANPDAATTRQDVPIYIDVLGNDGTSCGDGVGSLEIASVSPPQFGSVSVVGTEIRYSPALGFVGTDEFTYTARHTDGATDEADVVVDVMARLSTEDGFASVCATSSAVVSLAVRDPWIDPESPSGIELSAALVGPPLHGVLVGDLEAIEYLREEGETQGVALLELTYVPSPGFTGEDVIHVRFEDPFGNGTTAWVDVSVLECAPGEAGIPQIVVAQGEVLPIIVPEGFASVIETAWSSVLLIDFADGTEYSTALSVAFSEEIDRYVIHADTGLVPIGRYLLVIPLGNGETVELTIEVCAPDP